MDHPPLNIRPIDAIGDSSGFFRAAGNVLGWASGSSDVVLDVGCGFGRSSDTLLRVFPDIERVVAVDVVPTRIEEAKRTYPDERIEYRFADIENKDTLCEWRGKFSKIASFYCFNCLKSQRKAFRNVHHLMTFGGTAAVLLESNSPLYDVLKHLTEHAEWKEYMMKADEIIPESHTKKWNDLYYRDNLENIGFEVILCKEMETFFTFSSNEECRKAIFGACPLTKALPSNRRQEFMDYAFKFFMEQNSSPKTLKGLPYLKQCTVSILIRKPFLHPISNLY